MKILDSINSPMDIKTMTYDELYALAGEIREEIITATSNNGGHLSSNLGVVELTLACHKMFDSPKDKLIFDVGHQTYTHKILTGRKKDFHTIRTYGGLSGFLRPDESEHDVCISGHSSTSISTAVGICTANILSGDDSFTVAIIGDGATTGGLSFEGFNNAPPCGKMIVLLNDNEISISKNVGSLSGHLSDITSRPNYIKLKDNTTKAILSLPLLGKPLKAVISKTKALIKHALIPRNLFENLGFEYYGPIDGHNIEHICILLERAKKRAVPTVIHVQTIKGKGCKFAEEKPSLYHGVPKFNKDTGELSPSSMNFSKVFGETLCELAREDERIVAVTAAMGMGLSLTNFEHEFSDRYFDVGIAEQHAVTFSAGLALAGKKPYFAVYSTFLQRAYDQLIHDVSIGNVPVVIAIDRAGITGEDGETHHGVFDVAFMQHIPNFELYTPSTYEQLTKAVRLSKDATCPVAIRYPRGAELPIEGGKNNGFVNIYGDEDTLDVIVTYGRITANCIEALDILKQSGRACKLLSLERVKPLPLNEILAEINENMNVFFIEEGIKTGGIGEKLCIDLIEQKTVKSYKILAIEDEHITHGKADILLDSIGLSPKGIADFVLGG